MGYLCLQASADLTLHSARLCFIEELKPVVCHHSISASKLGDGPWALSKQELVCDMCGVQLKPPEAWSPVEEK